MTYHHPQLAPASLCVAPMMALTDRHCRYLHRTLAPGALLFTEMVTSAALVRGPRDRLLADHVASGPTALQLGGSDPKELAIAAQLGHAAGFAEINLNVGCPSDRVRQGAFGACLMREPLLVAQCVAAMRESQPAPVTVKCRLGVDDADSQPLLEAFCDQVVAAGTQRLYIHARKAILGKLSPAQNRQIPPLDYHRVHQLAQRMQPLPVVINGGIGDLTTATAQLALTSGVMLGRAAFYSPELLVRISQHLGHLPTALSVHQQVLTSYAAYGRYVATELELGTPLHLLVKPLLGLFGGMPGARRYRQTLSDNGRLKRADPRLLDDALNCLQPRAA